MADSCSFGLMGLLVLFSIASNCRSQNGAWWSIGIEYEQSEFLDCSKLNHSLDETGQQFCLHNGPATQLIAIGSRKGIIQCQEIFTNNRWNCTTFQGEYLFGLFAVEGTRETAYLNSQLPAFAGYWIAISCRDEIISNCTCSIEGVNKISQNATKLYTCDDDDSFAKDLMTTFLNDDKTLGPEASVLRRAEVHNHKVGLNLLSQKREVCRCVGLSGTCTLQTCSYKSPKEDDLTNMIQEKYNSATLVYWSEITRTFKPVNPVVQLKEDSLIYTKHSPSFCTTDLSKGIIGTEHRECDTSQTDNGFGDCSSLCCDRGYYSIEEQVTEQKCQFVWCCRVECTTQYTTIVRNFCNP